MTDREQYIPGPANLARVEKQGENWTLVLVRELRHSPEKVWQAITDPAHLREWAPFDANWNLGTARSKVKLTTVGAPGPYVTETTVTRATLLGCLSTSGVTSTCDGNSKLLRGARA